MIAPMYSVGATIRALTYGSSIRSTTAPAGILDGFSMSCISPSVR